MSASQEVSDVIEKIHDAALEPEEWPAALEAVGRYLDSPFVALATNDSATGIFASIPVGLDPVALSSYLEHYGRINPVWPPTTTAPIGAVMLDREVALDYEKSEFFNDWALPNGCYAAMALKVLDDGPVSAVVSLQRGRHLGVFDRREIERFQRLAPHLRQAVRVNLRLAALAHQGAGVEDALDRLAQGTILVDRDAGALFVNQAAYEILGARDGLYSGPDGLRANTPEETRALRSLIGAVSAPSGAASPGGMLPIRRRSPRRPLSVLVTSLRRGWGAGLLMRSTPAAIVFVTDPEREAMPPANQLRRLYALTPAEAAVALRVARGEGLSAVADALGISRSTAQTHLLRIFEKTDTHRQAELVRLLLRSGISLSTD